MTNSYCRKYILGFCDRTGSNNVLSHHGILGMSWGKRFGPPYPLGGVDKTVAKAEAKRKKETEKRVARLQKARKKALKAKAKAEKKEKKRLEEEAKRLEIKEKLLKKDNYKEIMKNSKYFTNEELAYLKDRHEQQIADKMDRFINKATKIVTAVNTVANVSQGIKMIQNLSSEAKLKDLQIKEKTMDIGQKAEEYARDREEYKTYGKKMAQYAHDKAKWESEQARGKANQEYWKGWTNKEQYEQAWAKADKEISSARAARAANALETLQKKRAYAQEVNSINQENYKALNDHFQNTSRVFGTNIGSINNTYSAWGLSKDGKNTTLKSSVYRNLLSNPTYVNVPAKQIIGGYRGSGSIDIYNKMFDPRTGNATGNYSYLRLRNIV